MSSLLQTAWRQRQTEKNVLRHEVAKATRYWGTRGRHVKKNMLRGFVQELGHDMESILDHAIKEGDTGDADLDAVAVMASETVLRTREVTKDEDESDDEDEDESDDEDENESDDEDEDEPGDEDKDGDN